MRKLKFFGLFCLLSYCTAFIAFAASTINQPPSPITSDSPFLEETNTIHELHVQGCDTFPIDSPEAFPNTSTVSASTPPALHAIDGTNKDIIVNTVTPPQEPTAPLDTLPLLGTSSPPLAMPLPSASPLENTAPARAEDKEISSPKGTVLYLPLPCATAMPQKAESGVMEANATSNALPKLPDITSQHEIAPSPSQPAQTSKQVSSMERPIQFSLPLPRLFPDRTVAFIPAMAYRTDFDFFHEAAQQLQSLTITPVVSPHIQQGVFPASSFNKPVPSGKAAMNFISPPPSHDLNKKKTFQLANGLRVILQKDDRFPLVSLRLYVRAGSAYETPKEAGISHVLEHMVFKGSKNYGDGEIAREIERNGGYLNAFTSFDQTGYVIDLPSSTWEKGLSVLKEMAFLPNFTSEHLASEKEVIVAELKRGHDSPGNVLFTQMIDGMFSGSPYAHPIIGYEETIRSFTVQNLYDYHEKWYQPQAMTLVICGNIDLNSAEKQVSSHFGSFTNDLDITPPLRRSPGSSGPMADIQKGPWQKIRLTLAFPAPNLRDNKAIYLDLLTHIIGGDQTSPLFKKYKYDKRLVDSISMQNYSFEESGLVFVMATLEPENIKPFWLELLQDMRQGFHFDKEDLARAQFALQDSFYRSRETLEGYASQIGHFNFYFSGATDAQNYLTTISTASLDTLNELYTETFQSQQAGIFGIIPEGMVFDQVTGDGAQVKNQDLESWLMAELSNQWPAASSPQEAARDEQTALQQEVITLDNGCSLILTPDATLPYISATMLFDGGEALLTPTKQGLGALTANVLTRGTKTKDYSAIQTFLADRAASLTASSNRQTFGLSFSSPSQYTQDLFALVNEVITAPAFSEGETDRAKENLQAAIIRSEEQPLSLAFRHLTAFLYPRHPYGFLQLGTPESIASFTHADLQAHWQAQRSYPWTLSVCGDFSKKDIVELARQLPSPAKTMRPLPPPSLTQEKELTLYLTDRQQAHLFLIFPIPGINTPDEAGLELLTNILAGQSGILFNELRDKQGLGYTVTAFPWKTQNAGALIFYIGTKPDSIQKAHSGFKEIISSLKTTPLDTLTLDRGKNILSGEYYRERQSLSARSAEGATLTAFGLPLDFKSSLITQSQVLTANDIQQIAQKYLNGDKSFILKILPQPAK